MRRRLEETSGAASNAEGRGSAYEERNQPSAGGKGEAPVVAAGRSSDGGRTESVGGASSLGGAEERGRDGVALGGRALAAHDTAVNGEDVVEGGGEAVAAAAAEGVVAAAAAAAAVAAAAPVAAVDRYVHEPPWYLRAMGWDCESECRHTCMNLHVEARMAWGDRMLQYYGKWPFR